MLPTNGKDIAMLSKRVKDGMLQSANGPEGVANCNTMWQPQHLYITDDSEIKKGDWFINLGSSGHPGVAIYRANSENSKAINEFKFPEIKKIIATTDIELHYNKVVEEDMHMYKESLPHIPQHIIEAYVKKPFDKVLVEYLPKLEKGTDLGYDCIYIVPDKPKLNTDGTLVVSLVEEDIEQKMLAHFNGKRGSFLNKKLIHEIVEWIKENL